MSGLPVPFGWFQVGWPEELPRGGVRPLRLADRHLTLWRDEDGVAHLHDAHCPHLGAHLGHGGEVLGRSVVCPLHGRRFDAEGRNVHVPGGSPDEHCALRSHPVVERNGLLLAWIHPDGALPGWEIPDIPELTDDRYTAPQRREFAVGSAWQEMAENGADRAHFAYVHGQEIVPAIDSYETDGPISRMRSTQRWPTADGVVDAFVDATSYGPGFSVIRMTGVIDTVSIGCNTPVSTNRCHLRFSFAVKETGDEAMTALVGDAFINLLTEQIGEDIRIWEHKRYLPRPALAPGEGPIMQFRSWAAQFYDEAPIERLIPPTTSSGARTRGYASGRQNLPELTHSGSGPTGSLLSPCSTSGRLRAGRCRTGLVLLGAVEVGDPGRPVDLGVARCVRAGEGLDHVPVLDDAIVAVGVGLCSMNGSKNSTNPSIPSRTSVEC